MGSSLLKVSEFDTLNIGPVAPIESASSLRCIQPSPVDEYLISVEASGTLWVIVNTDKSLNP
jgi:hypothetical protein